MLREIYSRTAWAMIGKIKFFADEHLLALREKICEGKNLG